VKSLKYFCVKRVKEKNGNRKRNINYRMMMRILILSLLAKLIITKVFSNNR